MAGKIKTIFVCSNCGAKSPKWNGKCLDCGEWNTLVEETYVENKAKKSALSFISQSEAPVPLGKVTSQIEARFSTGMSEFDRVLGGGVVCGSLVLLGGDPGIGKSTILLQFCSNVSEDLKVLYISGEESKYQIKLRAERLGVTSDNLLLSSTTDILEIENAAVQLKPDVVIIDSIQTMTHPQLDSSNGSVVQVRECTSLLMRMAKRENISVFIIGHVNKDGAIAGPKVLEHIVDTVLYFEGERNMSYRILRTVKNRFGSTNEVGVFEMTGEGLAEVENPSAAMLSGRPTNSSGSCVTCVMEGSRPLMVEIQALATKSAFATPRRTTSGFDYNRMALLTAVLEKRGGFYLGSLDIFANVVGGA